MIEALLEAIGAGRRLAPALALLAGVLLGLSPVALPAVPVVMSACRRVGWETMGGVPPRC